MAPPDPSHTFAAPTFHSCNRVATFTPAQRLRHKPQFDAVYQRGQKLADSHFLILYLPNQLTHARLGLSISARSVGDAVNRNRIKRVIRESFRAASVTLPAVDIVVNSRSSARDSDNEQLRTRLAAHWQKLVKRCAGSS